MAASEKDIQDVINTLIAEGVGEGEEGMRRIAETILNRADQRGISPAEVVRERAQYTGYSNPGPGALRAQRDPNALSAAQAAWQLAQGPDDPTNGANHYWNPNVVNPSWAGSMQSLGSYGNHAFATDRPGYTRQPIVAPTPSKASPLMAQSRANTSPLGDNPGLPSALQQYITRENKRVTPASVEERVTARNRQFFAPDPFNGDPMTPANGQVIASIPSTKTSASDRVRGRNAWETIATIPTTGVGQPPSTRSVQSVSVRPDAFNGDPMTRAAGQVVATIPSRQPPPMSLAPISYAGQERSPPIPRASIPGPTPVTKAEDRLVADTGLGFNPLQSASPIQSGGLSRDAMARQKSYAQVALAPPTSAPVVSTPQAAPLLAASAPIPLKRPSFAQPATRLAQPVAQSAPLMAQSRQPLSIVVQGANAIQPAQFQGSATGQTYTQGQILNTANGPVRVNDSGGFTNVETGRTSGHTTQGGMRYDPDSASFKRV